ncbi:glycerol-3-phosphate 1-O-acyltransferase PlsY [Parasphingopyxis marina]|uniref:Glycerol-3-phosphate acyltransferase n=1 Tax=Parasphingopyxis marina TaxID=2761622 RepID=A0A842I012_9SPHN|nr:glycerol-3-phosphate 1-O-acyltransferase PlsY [Parasphingopyxis marina]MBC2777520.1 glycerol-3-phosphate 1-O-acyltransferase PlsY [Parasphingopyxis marina]
MSGQGKDFAIFDHPLWLAPALALFCGYLFGSVPFGILLTRAVGAGDLRQIGSGNIGATNVLRTGRKGLAATTLLLDVAKGFAAVKLAPLLGGDPESMMRLAAVGAFFGHCYPVWLKFRGGKGVATLLGIAAALGWIYALVFALVWLAMVALFRFSSLGGISAAVALPIAAFVRVDLGIFFLFGALALLVLWKHRSNIGRLLRREEPKVGGSKKPRPEDG